MISNEEFIEKMESEDASTEVRFLSYKYIPEEILNRDDEIEKITSEFSKHFGNGMGENLLLLGPSGAGKTHVIKRIKEDLENIIEKEDLNGNITYLNCNNLTIWQIFVDLNRKIGFIPKCFN